MLYLPMSTCYDHCSVIKYVFIHKGIYISWYLIFNAHCMYFSKTNFFKKKTIKCIQLLFYQMTSTRFTSYVLMKATYSMTTWRGVSCLQMMIEYYWSMDKILRYVHYALLTSNYDDSWIRNAGVTLSRNSRLICFRTNFQRVTF
jgi:hypothetical protein